VFNKDGRMYIPAESVYGVIEAKQDLRRPSAVSTAPRARSRSMW
jgi:hypothetical protein